MICITYYMYNILKTFSDKKIMKTANNKLVAFMVLVSSQSFILYQAATSQSYSNLDTNQTIHQSLLATATHFVPLIPQPMFFLNRNFGMLVFNGFDAQINVSLGPNVRRSCYLSVTLSAFVWNLFQETSSFFQTIQTVKVHG